MSIDIMNRIWWRQDLSSTEKLVGVALGDAANDEGVCWPAVDTIAQKTSLSTRTVQGTIRSLEAKALLRIVQRINRSSYYVFDLKALPMVDRERRIKEMGPMDLTGAGDAPVARSGAQEIHPTGAAASTTGAAAAPRTVIETSEETDSPPSPDGEGHSPQENLFGDQLPVKADTPLHEMVEARWAELKLKHPNVVGIRKLDSARLTKITARPEKVRSRLQTCWDIWREIFDRIEASRWLCGRKPPDRNHDRPFGLTIDFVLRPTEFLNILEGKYEDRPGDAKHSYDACTGRSFGPAEKAGRRALDRVLGPENASP